MQGYVEIYPVKPDGTDGRWRWARNTSEENIKSLVAKEMAKYKGKYMFTKKIISIKKRKNVLLPSIHLGIERLLIQIMQ